LSGRGDGQLGDFPTTGGTLIWRSDRNTQGPVAARAIPQDPRFSNEVTLLTFARERPTLKVAQVEPPTLEINACTEHGQGAEKLWYSGVIRFEGGDTAAREGNYVVDAGRAS
jgi:hypothetical protein